jgi:hypothetical protein
MASSCHTTTVPDRPPSPPLCPHCAQSLDRAMQALPPRKHVKVLAAAALLHFKQGSAERGRTMAEALLRNHPKRLDLWSQYIDQVGSRHACWCWRC